MRAAKAMGVAILGLVVCVGCGGESEPVARNSPSGRKAVAKKSPKPRPSTIPGIEQLSLDPEEPWPGDVVQASVELGEEGGSVKYVWRIDGDELDERGSSLRLPGELSKGAVVEVEATPWSEAGMGTSESAEVKVGNRPPSIAGVSLRPTNIHAGMDILAVPRGLDPDGDELEYRYTWVVNDEEVEVSGAVLPGDQFARGDQIALAVSAHDGETEGDVLRSQPFEVQNAPPEVVSEPGQIDSTGFFRYRAQVQDADGDRSFRYELVEAPDGMTIDPIDGELVWRVSEGDVGSHRIRLAVDDRNGGTTTQSFQLNVAYEESSPAAPY